jgi:hypothetical protein
MIEMRRAQRSFGDGLIAAEVDDLREPFMAHADAVLADEQLMMTLAIDAGIERSRQGDGDFAFADTERIIGHAGLQ